jgi:hypothetical protein
MEHKNKWIKSYLWYYVHTLLMKLAESAESA